MVLLGSIAALVVVAGVGFLTVPKWQRNRLLASFQRAGLAAHEQGRHHEAVGHLNKYVRGMRDRPVEPAVRLALARSRAAWEASDGNHTEAAISQYRDYLRLRPDDDQAVRELVAQFRKAQMWLEARDAAARLRPADIAAAPSELIPVIRAEREARYRLDAADPLIPQLEARLLAESPPAFEDVFDAVARRQVAGDRPGVLALAEAYAAAAPDSLGSRVINAIYGGIAPGDQPAGPTIHDVSDAIAAAIGLDPATGAWVDQPELDDARLARVVIASFDLAGRQPWSQAVAVAAAASDADMLRLAAQRSYWLGDAATLSRLPEATAASEPVPDVLGYRAMSALVRGEAADPGSLTSGLAALADQSYRARSWLDLIEAFQALKDGKLVDARAKSAAATDRYRVEPMMHLVSGDVQEAMGRTADALESWTLASALAEPALWPEPYLRRVSALLRAGRTVEAHEVSVVLLEQMNSPWQIAPGILEVHLRITAALARSRQVSQAEIRNAIQVARELLRIQGEGASAGLRTVLATLHAADGDPAAARAELAILLASPDGPAALTEVLQIDSRFGLGLAAELGVPALPERIENPEQARASAMTYAAGPKDGLEDRVGRAAAMLENGLRSAGADRPRWLRAIAEFDDQFRPSAAADSWRAAIEADPDNIDLLAAAASSEALGFDLPFVERQIARITELTASQQRTLPSQLRVARARATFGLKPTRRSREEAITMLRAVVASEPKNIAARNTLANMLRLPCPPGTPEGQRFEPDVPAAIEQYRAIAALIQGPEAIDYLFQITRLLTESGNEVEAGRQLMEVLARADGNAPVREEVARQLLLLGANQQAARVFDALFADLQGPRKVTAGLLLARTYSTLNDRARAQAVLRELQRQPRLDASQFFDLAQLLAQSGLMPEANAVLDRAADYGIATADAGLVRARFAVSFNETDKARAILAALTASDPHLTEPWLRLLRLLVELGLTDEAKAVAARAVATHPDDEDILYWSSLAAGDPAAATRAFAQRHGTDPSLALAFDRVESYEKRKPDLSPAQRIAELTALAREFSQNPVVRRYALSEMALTSADPAALYAEASAAAARFPADPDILAIATRAAQAAGDHAETLRLATLWRTHVAGSPIEPDLYAALARQAGGDHQAVLTLTAPYLDAATRSPDQPLYQQTLLIHARSDLALNGPESIRARLTPLAEQHESFRTTVWLDLAASSVTPETAARAWLQQVEPLDMGNLRHRLADAWGTLAGRFPASAASLWEASVRIASQAVAQTPDSVEARAGLAEALRNWALTGPAQERPDRLGRAETAYLEAFRLQPSNLPLLFSAARCADQAGRWQDAERHYRTILQHSPTDLFNAAVRNNLASILASNNPSPDRLREALSLADEAVAFRPLDAFVGTRGWVRLQNGDHSAARQDFERVIQNNPASPEAWFGLAVLAKVAPLSDGPAATEAFERAVALQGEAEVDPKIVKVLSDHGFTMSSDN